LDAGKIFVEMPNDVGGPPKRREDVDEAEHLHLKNFVAPRESHHALVETGFGENRFRMLIDELENLLAAPFDFALQDAHEIENNPV
jgi:hypothetical protein